jgi:hypothetical protein
MEALAQFIAAHEAEHGTISTDEIAEATRRARANAVVVRGDANASPARRRRGA